MAALRLITMHLCARCYQLMTCCHDNSITDGQERERVRENMVVKRGEGKGRCSETRKGERNVLILTIPKVQTLF